MICTAYPAYTHQDVLDMDPARVRALCDVLAASREALDGAD